MLKVFSDDGLMVCESFLLARVVDNLQSEWMKGIQAAILGQHIDDSKRKP